MTGWYDDDEDDGLRFWRGTLIGLAIELAALLAIVATCRIVAG